MDNAVKLSMKRIKTWGTDSPMLYNDALKVVRYLEHLVAVENGDMENDPEYQAFVESQAKHCRCQGPTVCAGVLAGGFCDELIYGRDDNDWTEEEWREWYDEEMEYHGE